MAGTNTEAVFVGDEVFDELFAALVADSASNELRTPWDTIIDGIDDSPEQWVREGPQMSNAPLGRVVRNLLDDLLEYLLVRDY